jgi:hypothetical protein
VNIAVVYGFTLNSVRIGKCCDESECMADHSLAGED